MRLARDSLLLFVMQSVALVMGVLNSILISRGLGPEYRGLFFVVFTLSQFMANVGSLGVDFTNLYLLSKARYTLRQIHTYSLVMVGALSGIIVSGYWLLQGYLHATVLSQVDPTYAWVGIALVPVAFYNLFWGSMMAGTRRFSIVATLGIVWATTEAIVIFFALWVFKLDLFRFLVAWAASSTAFSLLRLAVVLKLSGSGFSLPPSLIKEGMSFGLKGYPGNIAYRIYNRLDVFMVLYFTGAVGVGFYSLAISLAEKAQFLVSPVMNAANPRIGSASAQDAQALTARIVRHSVLLAGASSLLLLLITPWGVPLLYGDEFRPAVLPMLILLPGTILITVSMTISNYFTYQVGRPEIPAVMAWLTLAVNVPLMLFLASHYGLLGAALATTLTYLVRCLMAVSWYLSATRQPWQDLVVIRPADIMAYLTFSRETMSSLLPKARRPFAAK